MGQLDFTWLDIDVKKVEGHMRPGPEALEYWTNIYKISKFKSLMEIGFNAGHSSAFILEMFPDVRVHSYDIGWHDYTEPNAQKVKDRYGKRFDFTKIDSKKIDPKDLQYKYDIMYIDGDHQFDSAYKDIQLFIQSTAKWAVIDDTNVKSVAKAMKHPTNLNRHYKIVWEGSYIAHPKGNPVTGALVKKW